MKHSLALPDTFVFLGTISRDSFPLAAILLLLSLLTALAHGQNLALQKRYTLLPEPNYQRPARAPADWTHLTDGKLGDADIPTSTATCQLAAARTQSNVISSSAASSSSAGPTD